MNLTFRKNLPAITLRQVYDGIATSIPIIPPIWPAIRRTMNISRGCALMLLEYMIGWKRKLSTSWVTQNMAATISMNTQKLTSSPRCVAHIYFITTANTVPVTPPVSGPT